MQELFVNLAEMQQRATDMKRQIATAPCDNARLREALYKLEAAIYVLERTAADAYRVSLPA